MGETSMIKLYKYSYYIETNSCEAWLEEMALNGWVVDRFTRFPDFVRFRKDVPQSVHYCFYFNELRQLDEESFIQSAKDQGWINLNKNPILARTFLFISNDIDPIPLETDQYEQENVYRLVKKKPSNLEIGLIIILIPLLIINIFQSGWWFITSPVFLVVYMRLFWMFEFMFTPKQYKRISNYQRRYLALFFRTLRFIGIPLLLVLYIFILPNV
jgi:hypothetical protein